MFKCKYLFRNNLCSCNMNVCFLKNSVPKVSGQQISGPEMTNQVILKDQDTSFTFG